MIKNFLKHNYDSVPINISNKLNLTFFMYGLSADWNWYRTQLRRPNL